MSAASIDPEDTATGRGAGGGLVVISPHLDDAVFSCGELLAAHPGSSVVTVFAGAPADAAQRLTDWDRHCGFATAAEAMATRRQEDSDALAILGARPLVLDFCDSQYGMTPTAEQVAAALVTVLDRLRPAIVLYPFGLFHSDHLLVHQACAQALAASGISNLLYEDALYRALPGRLQQRMADFARAGLQATPVPVPRFGGAGAAVAEPAAGHPLAERKRQAIQAYLSQLRAFGEGGYADTAEPERRWRLEPMPAAESSTAPAPPPPSAGAGR